MPGCELVVIPYVGAHLLQHEGELLDEYSAECSIPAIGAYNPQWEMYRAMEQAGHCQVFGAYVGLRMVGFACVLTAVLPHYGVKAATVESLFVASAHRNTNAGEKLMEALEAYAREQGCRVVLYSAPAGGRLERLLNLKPSYERTNVAFCRALPERP